MKKYIGAMVRKSIRVVLVAENDLLEDEGDLSTLSIDKPSWENSWSCVKKL